MHALPPWRVVWSAHGGRDCLELPAGTYRVEYQLTGFGMLVREGIVLTTGFAARVDVSLQLAAVWVIAHHHVVATRSFLFVALTPFVVLNPLLIGAAVAFPQFTVFFLFLLLWHLHGASGDWALLNFLWIHRERGFWTFDDAANGTSYFYGRAR